VPKIWHNILLRELNSLTLIILILIIVIIISTIINGYNFNYTDGQVGNMSIFQDYWNNSI